VRWRDGDRNTSDNIKRADEHWSTVAHQPEPVVVGAPCRPNPPSVVLTRACVTDPDAFEKNADVLARDLGPKTPSSSVATVPKLPAGPDYLVEIEAVANLE
jgi:hypothetical protein